MIILNIESLRSQSSQVPNIMTTPCARLQVVELIKYFLYKYENRS